MKKFLVPFKAFVTVYVEVEAVDEESAVDEAWEIAHISHYSGNGARSGKLIGVSGSGIYIDASDELEPIEDDIEEL